MNAISAALAYLFARPVLSHALEAAFETVLWILIGHGIGYLVGLVLPLSALIVAIVSVLVAAATVVWTYYGREAGQREHDLKNLGWSPTDAWLGARLFFGWSSDNAAQWASPCASCAAVCALFLFLR